MRKSEILEALNYRSLSPDEKADLRAELHAIEQSEQAVRYMRALDIIEDAIQMFMKDGSVFKSVGPFGSLYDLDEDDKKRVASVEARFGCKVYTCIEHKLMGDDCLSMLCVSKYKEDWEYEMEDLAIAMASKQHAVMAYVENKTADFCSEFGTIVVQSIFGGLRRVA